MTSADDRNGLTYAQAGVDVDRGNAFVERIKPFVRSTARSGADGAIGGFGGVFDLKAAGFSDPLLVAANDGVGTKVKIAIETGRHGTIGIDLVAMCVNDLIVQGAEPLFFLDYYATAALDIDTAASVVKGIAEGCRMAGAALIGGETAEMPGLYTGKDYDLAGFAVGAVERDRLLPRPDISPGDRLIALGSSGIHSNGYSLVRRIVERGGHDYERPAPFSEGTALADALLAPTRIYVRPVLSALQRTDAIKGLAHITGGGITDNLPRILPPGTTGRIDLASVAVPPVFGWLAREGGVAEREMLRTFNCGVGMIVVAAGEKAETIVSTLAAEGEKAWIVGEIAAAASDAPPAVVYGGALSL